MQPGADTTLLVWMARLHQTEALVETRKAELHAHQQRRAASEADLTAEEAQTANASKELAAWREQLARLTQAKLQQQQDIDGLYDQLASARATTGLVAQRAALRQQLERLQAAASGETSVQDDYAGSCASFMQDQGSRGAQFKAKLQQVEERQRLLQQHADNLQLEQAASTLRQQVDRLQARLQMLTTSLTETKQGNACARAQVEAAANATAAQLASAQERLSAAKRHTFDLSRRTTVNAARLQQLAKESARCRQQCAQLEGLILRASATIDQLAAEL